jgi:mono/diheme cytochrome c family protein
MQPRTIPMIGRLISTLLLSACAWFCGMATISAQPVLAPAPASPPKPTPADALAWDSILKEQTPEPGKLTADFVFNVRNTADYEIAIGRLQPSCGCTTAKLPSTPWVLAPQTNGDIAVSVNLAGKFGPITKTVTVFSTNNQIMKVLTVKVNLPNPSDSPEMMRARNRSMAQADAQAVFKGDCAKCHADPARGKMGKALYVAACAICHESKQRDHMVPDLHNLPHPTFYGYWKFVIAEGKPKSLMPAFSAEHGGPLTEDQIDSLAKILTQAFPSMATPMPTNAPAIKTGAIAPAPANASYAVK